MQEVDVGDRKLEVFSHYLLVPKRDGGLCPILDHRGLNCYLRPLKCKMLMVLRFGFEEQIFEFPSPWHPEPSLSIEQCRSPSGLPCSGSVAPPESQEVQVGTNSEYHLSRHVPGLRQGLIVLQHPPFEPLEKAELKWLPLKTAFLLAITSARRISELQALSVHGECCRWLPDGQASLADASAPRLRLAPGKAMARVACIYVHL